MNGQDKRQGLREAIRKAQEEADRIGPVDPNYDHKAHMDELVENDLDKDHMPGPDGPR